MHASPGCDVSHNNQSQNSSDSYGNKKTSSTHSTNNYKNSFERTNHPQISQSVPSCSDMNPITSQLQQQHPQYRYSDPYGFQRQPESNPRTLPNCDTTNCVPSIYTSPEYNVNSPDLCTQTNHLQSYIHRVSCCLPQCPQCLSYNLFSQSYNFPNNGTALQPPLVLSPTVLNNYSTSALCCPSTSQIPYYFWYNQDPEYQKQYYQTQLAMSKLNLDHASPNTCMMVQSGPDPMHGSLPNQTHQTEANYSADPNAFSSLFASFPVLLRNVLIGLTDTTIFSIKLFNVSVNPVIFDASLVHRARYFIIKSDYVYNVHQSIKYGVWCSTRTGNQCLDEAYQSVHGSTVTLATTTTTTTTTAKSVNSRNDNNNTNIISDQSTLVYNSKLQSDRNEKSSADVTTAPILSVCSTTTTNTNTLNNLDTANVSRTKVSTNDPIIPITTITSTIPTANNGQNSTKSKRTSTSTFNNNINSSPGHIILFFSVRESGYLTGVAEMISPVNPQKRSTIWQDLRFRGEFAVRWLYIKHIPNHVIKHILVECYDNRPVTVLRDTSEILPPSKGEELLRIVHEYGLSTSSSLPTMSYSSSTSSHSIGGVKSSTSKIGNNHNFSINTNLTNSNGLNNHKTTSTSSNLIVPSSTIFNNNNITTATTTNNNSKNIVPSVSICSTIPENHNSQVTTDVSKKTYE
ncbi:hypothetical protein Smp_140120.1 [Schistosoma mansoni]|nr:hypothetical protein Smp_140120.1 [Schistosoma mansoni]|eukprot:XP_018647130.1 hypothetical protein Smp_140120.1 [Schistosoma mansoni]